MRALQAAIALFLSATSCTVVAADFKCPKATEAQAEEMPEVQEAWCEKVYQGRTVMHGPYRAWWPNGRLGTSGQYINGEAVGKWSGWYSDGKKQGQEWFENGKVVKGQYWDRSGKETDARPNRTVETQARKGGARGSP